MKELTTYQLALEVKGDLHGANRNINGIFNILGDANPGDVVIRHWINSKGIEIAARKDVCCVITQDPREGALETAEDLNVPLIVTSRIEYANRFALEYSLKQYASQSLRIVVTGTNGKSTTSHLTYHILKKAGYICYTNTDSLSEFNTLIDPMVAKQISEFPQKIEAMVIEVSEVQGWEDRMMNDHAYLMTHAINPQILILTNVALDHIGLVNSIEEASREIAGALKDFEGDSIILNGDDKLIRNMESLAPKSSDVIFFGKEGLVENRDDGIYSEGKMFIEKSELPFQSYHFIQNTMAAISACLSLKVSKKIIKEAVKSYEPLKRRFSIISEDPLIVDDFAHNPDGILATVKSAGKLSPGILLVVCAIRGSRGQDINLANAQALAESLKDLDYKLIVTSSQDVVDHANLVKAEEKKIFIDALQKQGINYNHYNDLKKALKEAIKSATSDDTILLIGAQGMDPASDII